MSPVESVSKGSLVVVGSGILALRHITQESEYAIRHADVVFYVVADPITPMYLQELNHNVRSLHHHYRISGSRAMTYNAMAEDILSSVRSGLRVVAVFYGHPGVFVTPGHAAISSARAEGFEARMLPGISAEDCLIADLGVDPAEGLFSIEATSFVEGGQSWNPAFALILWQIGAVGRRDMPMETDVDGLERLQDVLAVVYPADHEAIVYEASCLPGFKPRATPVPIGSLSGARITGISTLYVPAVDPSVAPAAQVIGGNGRPAPSE